MDCKICRGIAVIIPLLQPIPQYSFATSNKGNAIEKLFIVLSQELRDDVALVPIGYYVFNKNKNIIGKGAFMVSPEVSAVIDCIASDGPYTLVPCTFQPNQIAKFNISIYSQQTVPITPVS